MTHQATGQPCHSLQRGLCGLERACQATAVGLCLGSEYSQAQHGSWMGTVTTLQGMGEDGNLKSPSLPGKKSNICPKSLSHVCCPVFVLKSILHMFRGF